MANLGETIRENPIPVALIGAGIGWLLMAGMRSDNGRAEYVSGEPEGGAERRQSGMARTAHETLDNVGRRAQSAYDSARRSAGDTWSAARARAARMGEGMRDRARDWGSSAGDRAQQACRSFGEMVEEQPLLLGAAGLIVGAALGAAIPRTRYEDEMLGETRDSLKQSAEEFGREQWDKAQRVVERTVETVREEAERQGLTPEALRETASAMAGRAGKVAQSAADAAREEAGKTGEGATGRDEGPGGPAAGPV